MTRVQRRVAGLSGVLWAGGVTAVAVTNTEHPDNYLMTQFVGLSWLVAGHLAWSRRPDIRVGPLMVGVGLCQVAQAGWVADSTLVWGLTWLLQILSIVLGGHLLLAFPSGRVAPGVDRIVVGALYLQLLLAATATLVRTWPPGQGECPGCGALVDVPRRIEALLWRLDRVVLLALVLLVLVRVIAHWRTGTPPTRRAVAPVLVSAAVVLALVFLNNAWEQASGAYSDLLRVIGPGSAALIPVAFLVGLLRVRIHHAVVGDLVVALSSAPTPAQMRDALARALEDPSLELAFWLPQERRHVDPDGRPFELPDHPGRAVTPLEQDGRRLGALVHDPALRDDRPLIEAAVAAAGLALENARLQADLRAQLREVRASRTRIVAAGDAERRRIERNLHDGAQQRLLGIRLGLQLARGRTGEAELAALLDEVDAEAEGALEELRALARGVHPAVLTEAGLAPALQALVRRCPVAVEITAVPDGRLPEPVETAAYFITSEALANTVKHAGASHARVAVRRSNGHAVIEVADDGCGGARLDAGSGLRGLRDRVEALDGTLELDSDAGAGTRLRAEIPCA